MERQELMRRESASESWPLVSISPDEAGWTYLEFKAGRLPTGASLQGKTEGREVALIVLGGRATFQAGGRTFADVGERRDVWERRPPYLLLLPPSVDYTVEARADLHLAVAAAPAPPVPVPPDAIRLIRPTDVVAEERGQGHTYRFIQHLLAPSAPAARLILVEVYTPGGNWSSFPPHKHDVEEPPRESYLEETYYYQIKPAAGFAFQRVYSADGSLDETLAPGNGDLVVVPRGYHPVATLPGHDCYYLNAMAGPSRAWNFQVDPRFAHLMNWQKPAVATSRP